jgi:hypothetical protein
MSDPFGLGAAAESLKGILKSFQTPAEPKEDWTDPGYVLGAVLAQIEDLEPTLKRRVLIDALAAVNDE